MLADPIVIGADSFPAISRGTNESKYQLADASKVITIGHQFKPQRQRFVMRLDWSKLAADPLASDRNIPVSSSIYLVVDRPVIGFNTNDLAVQTDNFLTGYLLYSTQAILRKVLGGET